MSEDQREAKQETQNGESAANQQSSTTNMQNMPAGMNPISMMNMMPNMFPTMQQSAPMQDSSQSAPVNPLSMGMPPMMNPMAFPFNPAAWNCKHPSHSFVDTNFFL
jgi:hypothetical protein